MQRIFWAIFLTMGLVTSAFAAPTIPLVGGDFAPPNEFAVELLAAGGLMPQHVLVQLERLPDAAERGMLAAAGLTLVAPLPGYGFFAAWDGRGEPTKSALPLVRYLGPVEIADKLDVRLYHGAFDAFAMREQRVAVEITLFNDVPLSAIHDIAAAVGGEVLGISTLLHTATVAVPVERAAEAASNDRVQFIAQVSPPWGAFNDQARANVQAEAVWDDSGEYGWDGTGVVGFIYDVAIIDADHPDLLGKVTQIDSPFYTDSHTSHVTCTFCGTGALEGGAYAGIAPGATAVIGAIEITAIWYNRLGDLDEDYTTAVQNHDVDLSSNSIGSNVTWNMYDCAWEGDYENTARAIDAISSGYLGKNLPIFWAAGNERGLCASGWPNCRCYNEAHPGYYVIPPPVPAKNTVTIGAIKSDDNNVAYFSSWGPTDDGRTKPTVTAPGDQAGLELSIHSCTAWGGYTDYEGTSMACPAAAGVGALLMEGLRSLDQIEQPPAELLKALIVAGAQDQGELGPDFMHGYGRVRANVSAELVRRGAYVHDAVAPGGEKRWWTEPESGEPLMAVLVWSDSPAQPNQATQLVNDLDLLVLDAGGEELHPFILDPTQPELAATTGEDHRNVEEQVVVYEPIKGPYIVIVRGTYLPEGEWPFALAGFVAHECDEDGDGFAAAQCQGDDCRDDLKAVNPDATEICDDNLDNDCNGLTDAADPACAGSDDDATPDDDDAIDDDTSSDDNDNDDASDDDDDDNDDGCGC